MALEVDRGRLVAAMREQAAIGGDGERALDRLALSDADREARDWFVDGLEAAGLDVRVDRMGNVFGRREGTDPDAAPVLVGSHLDSQPDGGVYDGALGVVAALEFVRSLEDGGIETRHPVEVVNWTNEEGSRFQPAMMGSGAWAGAHSIGEMHDRTDEDGARVGDELERIGYLGDAPAEPREPPEAYLELHVEQGPRLEAAGVPVGVVTGVVGITWGSVTFRGEADHSGPTPMHGRGDALVAAADFVTGIRRLSGALGERTVGTVGSLDVSPGSINVVPGEATATWDVRDPDDGVVERAYDRVLEEAEAAATREGVEWVAEERMRAPSVEFADRAVDAVESAADGLGYPSRRMQSGAGHDATHLADVCDAAMAFAPSEGGKSHSPEEHTSWEDCHRAANVLATAALSLAE